MKPTATLTNPARGHMVDEQALYRALKERWIAGAALDAWYEYPADLDTVMHGSSLPFHELENVVLTPHFAAWTEAMIRRRMKLTAENLDRLATGRDLLRVVYDGGAAR